MTTAAVATLAPHTFLARGQHADGTAHANYSSLYGLLRGGGCVNDRSSSYTHGFVIS